MLLQNETDRLKGSAETALIDKAKQTVQDNTLGVGAIQYLRQKEATSIYVYFKPNMSKTLFHT